jgi:signal transduction histidine kinase
MRTDLDEEAQQDLAAIKSAAVSMSHAITVLLDVARRDTRSGPLERTPLTELAAALRTWPRPDGRRLIVELDPELCLDVPQALAVRALAPVLDNAIRLSSNVQVTAGARGREVEILVADDGCGVRAEEAESLFEPGWSGSGSSGLGLSLARRVARTGGGDVTLQQPHNERGGATFVVTFPGGRARTDAADPEAR